MQYFITFLEGIISFISPCMLPMLPIYVTYFGGGKEKRYNVILRSVFFVLGFTLVFALLGLFAGTMGRVLREYKDIVNIVCGIVVIFFGLSYLEVLKVSLFKGMKGEIKVKGIFSAFVFGMIYSVSLTPCVGAFLGSALMLASTSGEGLRGTLLLIVYSLGLGIPFVLSAVLLDRLSDAFRLIKKNYSLINKICGLFLIIVGILMMFGILDRLISFFN